MVQSAPHDPLNRLKTPKHESNFAIEEISSRKCWLEQKSRRVGWSDESVDDLRWAPQNQDFMLCGFLEFRFSLHENNKITSTIKSEFA